MDLRRELSKEEVLSFWKETKRKTNVYIHSAFCKEQCTYCTYKGTLFEKNAFKQYHSEYLPNQIKFYEDVLRSDIIYSYFFGGGTPSLMTPEMMVDIFKRIPNFKECRRKVMEFHLCDWNKEQLNVLKEYSFNTVIACVQTFDNDTLKKTQRRIPKTPEQIYEFIKHANSLGLHTMSDIIFFDTGDPNRDLNRLSTDMQKLADHDITEISVQTIFNQLGKHDIPVSKAITDFLSKNPQYTARGADHPLTKETNRFANSKGGKITKETKVYKIGVDWDEMFFQDKCIDGMFSKPHFFHTTDYNILGIGSYKNHKHTVSKIEDKLEYIEDGDNHTPRWLLTYDKRDWSTKKMIADFYDKLEKTVGEPPDGINFLFSTRVMNYNEDTRDKEVQRELVITLSFQEHSITIDNYIEKLKKIGVIPEKVGYTREAHKNSKTLI